MKTFRIVGMAAIAFLIGGGFASCTKENDSVKEDEGLVVNEKKLTKIANSTGGLLLFNYDDKGRVIEVIDQFENKTYYKETIIWGDNAIKISSKEFYSNAENTSLTLSIEDGLIQSDTRQSVTTTYKSRSYIYNQSQRLIEYGNSVYKLNTIWDGDKLVSAVENQSNGSNIEINIKYGQTCLKGYFPLLNSILGVGYDSYFFLANPEVAGLRTNHLPNNVTRTGYYGEDTKTYSYKFDEDGYISTIIVTEDTETYSYNLTWE